MVAHKDEALWLSAEQQAEWLAFKRQVGAPSRRSRIDSDSSAISGRVGAAASPRRCLTSRRRLLTAAATALVAVCYPPLLQVPMLWFGAFMAFNSLAWVALRIINRRRTIKHPKNHAYIKAA